MRYRDKKGSFNDSVSRALIRYLFAGALMFALNSNVVAQAGVASEDPVRVPTIHNPWAIYGSIPKASASRWSKIMVLGNRNSVYPILWISPDKMVVNGPPERVIHLSKSAYEEFLVFTESQRCSSTRPIGSFWGAIEISKHSESQTKRFCTLLHEPACDYLKKLMHRTGIDWSRENKASIGNLEASLRC